MAAEPLTPRQMAAPDIEWDGEPYSTGSEVYLVGLRWGHHSGYSGYEGFRRYVGHPLASPVKFRYLERAWRVDDALSSLVRTRRYSLALLMTELATSFHMLGHRSAVYHAIYGDTDLRLLGAIGRLAGVPVVATFHEPPWGLDYMKVDRFASKDLAAVILVSNSQRPYFDGLIAPERVFVVPHGVDTDFFSPDGELSDEPVCIIVGSKYREFRTLSGAIDVVRRANPRVRFVAVGTDIHTRKPLEDDRVEYLRDLDDCELRRAYRSARLAVFPLLFATANNALLEAMACGLPVVATDVGGVREYLGDDGGVFCPAYDPEALAEAILRIVEDDSLASSMARANRERVMGFDYRLVAKEHCRVYRSALALRGHSHPT